MTTMNDRSEASDERPAKREHRKAGAPLSNRNSLRHGLRGGQLPAGCSWIAATTATLRTALEDAVVDAKGAVSVIDAAHISTAARWERHALLAQRWLRVEFERLTLAERLSYSQAIAQASASRDKSIAALGINQQSHSDSWGSLAASLYSQPATTEGLATGTALASPQTSAGSNPPHETDEGENAREKFKQEATAGVAAVDDQDEGEQTPALAPPDHHRP